ncbi:hypothetical protein [Bailinhaonella thermotolerans]|uniref:Uncharacterized protein n=1 Tax=Bailinhaonella thermotolerans TaxID=1070861 RepID=A0A3A4AAF7_9ACTN|nr:hypothetical protein [Bailinhaonella thermotolerans]RJL25059.1 hypothetical protein D5H75_27275 [Bailinhaonella thermotolerans]
MTDRIEAAAEELRPLVEEFIVWAGERSLGVDADLAATPALWHRIAVRDRCDVWTREDLREVLLQHLPQVTDDPEKTGAGTLPAMRAYLGFLDETGRLARGSDDLAELTAELDSIGPEFEAVLAEPNDIEWDDEDEDGLGDFRRYADQLEELPTMRLAPESELAGAVRGTPLLAKARDLALWVGEDREVGEDETLTEDEIEQAGRAAALGALATHPEALYDLWDLAVDLGFIESSGENRVSCTYDPGAWPDASDEDVIALWMDGVHSVVLADPAPEDDDLAEALMGLGSETLIHLLLAQGAMSVDELREDLAEAVAEAHELGEEAWESVEDPVGHVIAWLSEYNVVETEPSEDSVRLTPLGLAAAAHLAGDEGVAVDVRPPVESMPASVLLDISTGVPEEEAEAEYTAWLALRTREQAARELLEAAAKDEDALVRVQAARLVDTLGEDAEPALREALDVPLLRPYALMSLNRMGAAGVPTPGKDDTNWMVVDILSIALGMDEEEFVTSLDEIGPPAELVTLIDAIWRLPHPDVVEVLENIAALHPDNKVSKAARGALFRARSR